MRLERERRDAIKAGIIAGRGDSNRALARRYQVTHKTIGRLRREIRAEMDKSPWNMLGRMLSISRQLSRTLRAAGNADAAERIIYLGEGAVSEMRAVLLADRIPFPLDWAS